MRTAAVLSTDAQLEEKVRALGLSTTRVGPVGLADYTRAANGPDVMLVDVRLQHQLPVGLAAFKKQHPQSGVVLVTSTLEPRLMLEAMRAGVTECVHEPITPQALEDAIRRVLAETAQEELGLVLAFVGAKGGVGATTLAVNTAATLARGGDGSVLFIDLHVGHGDSAVFLGVEPRFSVLDALENVHRVDESFFKGIVEKTKARVDLLGPSDRLPQQGIDQQRLLALLDFAMRRYRITVLDVPRFAFGMLDVLENASTIVVVTSQEVSALRNAGRLMHTLRTRYGSSRVKPVVNRFDERAEINHSDVERVLGDSVKHVIPSDYRFSVDALNTGKPVVLEQGRLTQALRKLAADLGGISKQSQERPAGVLGRLALRRV